MSKLAPGTVRDAVHAVLTAAHPSVLSVADVHDRAERIAGESLPKSSVRSSLRLRVRDYEQVSRGHYKLKNRAKAR